MNVLILTVKYGMGHYTAAMSLKQELENETTEVEVVDFFDVIFPRIKNSVYRIFNFLVSRCSGVYNLLYKLFANANFTPFKRVIKKRMEKLMEEKHIDMIVSTFPICSKYVSVYKKVKNSDFKLYTYITDIDVNQEWLTDETDSYFVASHETKQQMLAYHVPEEKIKIVGIPVRKEFKELKIKNQKNEVVVMGGGLGLIPCMEQTLEQLAQNQEIHITVLAGKNQKLFDKYHNQYSNMTVVGYTDNVYQYMEKAELIITKAGGITLFEAIHSNTPMYVLYPFLRQEIGNAKFIEKTGIGSVIWNKKENATQDILNLLKEPEKLEKMRRNMQAIKADLERTNVVDVYQKGA